MFEILKQLNEQKKENERLKMRCELEQAIAQNYCGWMFAYRNAIAEMTRDGDLTKEQSDMLFGKAKKYYDHWTNN